MSNDDNCKVTDADRPGIQKGCTAANFLELTRYLKALGLLPMLKSTTTIQSSPFELSQMISNAQLMIPFASSLTIGRRGQVPTQTGRHGQCHVGNRLAANMAHVLDSLPWPVEHQTLNEIRRNAGE
jgi:hypothetical protein